MAENLKVNLKTSKNSDEFDLKKNSLSRYHYLDPDIYEILVDTDEKSLLKNKIGLAAGEKYTTIIYGNPNISSKLNEATFSYKLHSIFEGAENYSKNGFLPSQIVFRDEIKLKKGLSALRIFHAAAGISPITVKIGDNKSSKKLVSTIAYPKPILSEHFNAGNKTVEVYMKDAPEPIIKKEFIFESEKSYLIIFSKMEENPSIKILEN